jgi:hypothetical protein
MSNHRPQLLDTLPTVSIPAYEREVMTLEETAEFLRFSRSILYQRHNGPIGHLGQMFLERFGKDADAE